VHARKPALPDLDPRRRAPKRYFGSLIMPPVDHPPGALIEACEPPTNPVSRRMAKVLMIVAGAMALGAVIFSGIYGHRKAQKGHGHSCVGGATEPKSASRPGDRNRPAK